MRKLLLLVAFLSTPVFSEDANLEKRVTGLAHELLADLVAQVDREQLAAGKSEGDVIDFMVARYGDFVLYRPPLKASTVLLWAGPFLFLLFGIWFLIRRVRKQALPERQLSEAERARAAKLLE